MVGADVCGFQEDTTEELCIRWMQLGSFYPFMRNHNNNGAIDQDPGAFSLRAQQIMRDTLRIRYGFLPYLYTLYYHSNLLGKTVVRPLFFEYPQDTNTYSMDRQFIFGPAILITPVLEPNTVTVLGYFTNDTWNDFYTGKQQPIVSNYTLLNAPLEMINIHLRGGHIIPIQYAEVTTTASRLNPYCLLVALGQNSNGTTFANGSLFWDDSESTNSIEQKAFNEFVFKVIGNQLQIIRVYNGYSSITMQLDAVRLLGVKQKPTNITINQQPFFTFDYDKFN
jgi:alpha-glucosidase (family GH31 glycosyl hydrolase)